MRELATKDTGLFYRMIEKSGNIVTVSHAHPDGDAVGSSFGLAGWIASLGKQVVSIFPDPIPGSISFLRRNENVLIYTLEKEAAETAIREADLIICLDFNAFNRAEGLEPFLRRATCPKVLIDHHINPDRSSFDLCFSTTEISSASELMFWILMEMPGIGGDASRLPASCAADLMTGMTTDTNNFANSTLPSTLRMASMLLEAGVDRDAILESVLQGYKENRIRLMGHILKDLLVTSGEGTAWFILDEETARRYGIRDGDTEGFVNIPLTVRDIRMSVFLRQENDHFRVSVRSKRGISANAFAIKYFHGGGHENAAGGKLYWPSDIPSPGDAGRYLENALKEFMA